MDWKKERFHVFFPGQRFVAIIDPGVPEGEPVGSYPAFEEGVAQSVWIEDGRQPGTPIKGKVWPENPTYFPDFTNPATQ